MNVLFFILSFSRSGSTLLANLLNNHSNINVSNETWVFPTVSILGWEELNYNQQRYILHIYNESLRTYKNSTPVSHEICNKDIISFSSFYKKMISHGSCVSGEKNPVNTLYFDYLKKNFKYSKYVFLARHPLAIANSYKNRWHKDQDEDYFLFRVSSVIKTYFLSYRRYCDDLNIRTFRYEDIVKNPVVSLNSLCDHLGIEYDEKMLSSIDAFMFHDNILEYHKDLFKDVHVKNVDKYKQQLSDQEIQSLSYLLRDVIAFFGYPNSKVKPSKLLLSIEKKVDKRLRYNRSLIRVYFRKLKYYLFYLKYTITR